MVQLLVPFSYFFILSNHANHYLWHVESNVVHISHTSVAVMGCLMVHLSSLYINSDYVLILLIVVLPMGTIEEEVSGGSHGGSAFNNITNNGGGGNGRTNLKLSCTNFLSKLYKMVDNKATNSIISWGSSSNTFIISDEGRFISEILPCYFKINHLDNFTYQLNNYVSISFLTTMTYI